MALTLILEDGTGTNPNANAYVDLAYVQDYAESILGSTWNDNCSLQVMAIVNATRFIDQRFGGRISGYPVDAEQPLVFPRSNVCSGTASGLPTALQKATAQAALQFIEDGILDLNANADNAIKSSAVSVGNGAVSESVSYFFPKVTNTYAVLDSYMAPLLGKTKNGLNITTVRG